jgi:flavin reductase (DIM6/NTAB) family NADH-FMN oxidoreductase RutF
MDAIPQEGQGSTDDHVIIDPATLARREQYKLMTATVVPRPIALVTTVGRHGLNAGAFSFYNAIGADPPMLMFSVGRRSNVVKDTVRNIVETREFVVHIVDFATRDKMNICGIDFGPGVNEIEEADFRTAASVRVRPPRLVECPIQMECRLMHITTLGHYDVVFGEVLLFHFRRDVIDQHRHIDVARVDPLGRLGADVYVRATDLIRMPRLPVPPGKGASTD